MRELATGSSLDRWLKRHSTFAILVGLVALAASYLMERHTQLNDVGGGIWYLRFLMFGLGVVFAADGLRAKVAARRTRRRSA
jgi:hypothetical protein